MNQLRVALIIKALLLSLFLAIPTYSAENSCSIIAKNIITGRVPRGPEKYAHKVLDRKRELGDLNFYDVIAWKKNDFDAVRRFFMDKLNFNFLRIQEFPTPDPKQAAGLGEASVNEIRYLQAQARNLSADGKYSVIGNAKDMKNGLLKPTDLPPIRVFRDTKGRIWSLDHRRLAAIKLSGAYDKIEVEFVGPEVLKGQEFKFGTLNEGRSLFVSLDDGTAIVLLNKGQ